MPFNSPQDYYDPAPGIRAGLALGEAMARRKYQDQAASIAERRTAVYEQDQLSREVKLKEQAIALHEERTQYDEFKGKFNSFLGEEIASLPEEKRNDSTEFENAQRRAARKALPYAPSTMLGRILDTDLKQAALTERNDDSITARIGLQDERLAALERRDTRKIESQEKIAYDQMDSREYMKQMEIDAKAARSEDEYVLKLAPSYINKMGVAPVKADRELRARYRQIHGEKEMPGSSEAPAAGGEKNVRVFKYNPKSGKLD